MALNIKNIVKNRKERFTQEQFDKAMEKYFLEICIEDLKMELAGYDELINFNIELNDKKEIIVNANFDVKKSFKKENNKKHYISKDIKNIKNFINIKDNTISGVAAAA